MRILVTGAAGFIGYHTAERLLARGDEVIGLDNLNEYYDVTLKHARLARLQGRKGFTFHKIDLADQQSMDALFQKERPAAVIHLAAQAGVRYSLTDPHAYTRSNVTGFMHVLEGCRHNGVGHLVYASTSSVYGSDTAMPFSETRGAGHPLTIYAATKRANELMAHSYSHFFGLPASGLRFFTVYGPWGRPDMALFLFTKAILEGRPIEVFNEGRMQRDFTYVDDIVEGVVRTLALPPAHAPPAAIYNIGNSRAVPLTEFIDTLSRVLGRKAIVRKLPMQPGDMRTTYASIDSLRALTGFTPRTPLAEGLARFAAWYRGHYG